jgi:RimJ/RimL family protein N-acetyltransferase
VEKDSGYAFITTADDTAIGAFRKDAIHRPTAEIGYYIAELYWGKGIRTFAVTEICRWIFESTDITRIFVEPFLTNAVSYRILEKSGFLCEGMLRKSAVKNGVVLDMKIYLPVRGE